MATVIDPGAVPPAAAKPAIAEGDTRLGRLSGGAGVWAGLAGELFRADAAGALPRLARLINARLVSGIGPRAALLSGLADRPFRDAYETIPYWSRLHPALRLLNWSADGGRLIEDKLVTAERYAAHGIAAAPIVAVVGRDEALHPHGGRFPAVNDLAGVVDVLAQAPDELIIKPAAGSRGGDVRAAVRQGGAWVVDGLRLSSHQLAGQLLAAGEPAGLLIQPRLRSHPSLASFGGRFGLCSVRINTALLHGGPVLFFQFLKLLNGPAVTDNFRGGRSGNLLAAVDENSGRIRAVYRLAPNRRFLLTNIDRHPATGARLVGEKLPLWQDALDLALRAAAVTPECPLPGADVALTDDGPRILEINAAWDAAYAELTKGIGLKRMLRLLWPELAADPELKHKAATLMRLQTLKGAR